MRGNRGGNRRSSRDGRRAVVARAHVLTFLSHPAIDTQPSYHCARMTVSTLSAMISRDGSEYDMPRVPMLIPSLTPTVLKRRPTRPADCTLAFTSAERSSKCMLHGFPSYHTDAIPTRQVSSSDAGAAIVRCDRRRWVPCSMCVGRHSSSVTVIDVRTNLGLPQICRGQPSSVQHRLRSTLAARLRNGSAVLV